MRGQAYFKVLKKDAALRNAWFACLQRRVHQAMSMLICDTTWSKHRKLLMVTIGYFKVGKFVSHIVSVFFFQRVVALLVMAFVIVQSRCNVRKQFQLNVANWYGVLLPHPVTRFTYVSLCGVTMFAYRYVTCGILLETVALLCVECA